MSKRADKIRAEAAALRVKLEEQGLERVDALAQEAGFLLGAIEGLAARCDQLEGVGIKPSKGCMLAEVCDAEGNPFMVEYEYEPGSPGRYSGPPENCYPDEPAQLMICGVYYADALIDPSVFNSELIEKWEMELCEKQIEADREAEEVARAEADEAADYDRRHPYITPAHQRSI
jgi:hypothetical protein